MTRAMSSSRGKYYEEDDDHGHDRRQSHPVGQLRPPAARGRAEPMPNVFERQSLLGPGPVKLTPSWEEKNLPNDELNFKHLTLEDYLSDSKPPKDRKKKSSTI